jgi:hypothetical protein
MFWIITAPNRIWLSTFFVILLLAPVNSFSKPVYLNALPDTAYNFIIYRHLTRIVSLSQVELITEMKKENLSADLMTRLDRYLMASRKALEIMGKNEDTRWSSPKEFPNFQHETIADVSLTDPRKQATWVRQERLKILSTICKGYPAKETKNSTHDFHLFYMYNIQGFCDAKMSWRPAKKLSTHPFIKVFFDKGVPVPLSQIFARAHRYLESTNNKPFLLGGYSNGLERKSGRIFLAFYLQYSELALDARYLSMVNREFFVRRSDLRSKVKGFSIVQKLFSALIARELVG